MHRPAEDELLCPVLGWLAAADVASLAVNVPSHGRSRADVVGKRSDNSIIAVEIKVRDWPRAVHQAILNRYFASESYIAVWWSAITPQCERECARQSVGLISVERERCQLVLLPGPSAVHDKLAETIRQRLGALCGTT